MINDNQLVTPYKIDVYHYTGDTLANSLNVNCKAIEYQNTLYFGYGLPGGAITSTGNSIYSLTEDALMDVWGIQPDVIEIYGVFGIGIIQFSPSSYAPTSGLLSPNIFITGYTIEYGGLSGYFIVHVN